MPTRRTSVFQGAAPGVGNTFETLEDVEVATGVVERSSEPLPDRDRWFEITPIA
jgi:hypothetical protein